MRKRRALAAGIVIAGVLATGFFMPASADVIPQATEAPRSPLMRGLYDLIEELTTEQLPNKAELIAEIRAADRLFVRIKAQNKEGIRRANNPPRFVTR